MEEATETEEYFYADVNLRDIKMARARNTEIPSLCMSSVKASKVKGLVVRKAQPLGPRNVSGNCS